MSAALLHGFVPVFFILALSYFAVLFLWERNLSCKA
jgi:hypothetical protein